MYGLVGIVGAAMAMQTGAATPGVTFTGAVKNPGTVAMTRMGALQEAARFVGGFRPEADRRNIRIVSVTGAVRTVDLTKGGILPAVYPGDRVEVPAADPTKTVLVQGGVDSEGAFDFRPGMTVREAVAMANPVPKAPLDKVLVLRPDGKGTMHVHTANLLAMNGTPETLRAGDRIYVPRTSAAMSDRELLTIVLIGLIFVVVFD